MAIEKRGDEFVEVITTETDINMTQLDRDIKMYADEIAIAQTRMDALKAKKAEIVKLGE